MTDEEKIKRLEAENQHLRQTNAGLRVENSDLKGHINTVKKGAPKLVTSAVKSETVFGKLGGEWKV